MNDQYQQYLSTQDDNETAQQMLGEDDADLKEMAEEEITSGKEKLQALELELKKSLLPKDPNDS